MRGQSRLNNMKLGFHRKELLYEAIMTDLVLMGALPKDVVEKYIGHPIPDYLKPPATMEEPEGSEDR